MPDHCLVVSMSFPMTVISAPKGAGGEISCCPLNSNFK